MTAQDFLKVSGVGETKLERYGERFMKVIYDFSGNAINGPPAPDGAKKT